MTQKGNGSVNSVEITQAEKKKEKIILKNEDH